MAFHCSPAPVITLKKSAVNRTMTLIRMSSSSQPLTVAFRCSICLCFFAFQISSTFLGVVVVVVVVVIYLLRDLCLASWIWCLSSDQVIFQLISLQILLLLHSLSHLPSLQLSLTLDLYVLHIFKWLFCIFHCFVSFPTFRNFSSNLSSMLHILSSIVSTLLPNSLAVNF